MIYYVISYIMKTKLFWISCIVAPLMSESPNFKVKCLNKTTNSYSKVPELIVDTFTLAVIIDMINLIWILIEGKMYIEVLIIWD